MSICHSCARWQSQWAPYQLPLCPLAWDLLRLSFPNESRLWCFSIPRGWRLTCHTGWTKHAPVTRGVSITMMKTPPSAHVTPVLTDTERMSTTTTIKSSRTQTRAGASVNGQRALFLHFSPSSAFFYREHSLWVLLVEHLPHLFDLDLLHRPM